MQLRCQLGQCGDVGRGGATAATDHLHAQIFNEVQQLHLHFERCQAVVGYTADIFWQAGVGDTAHHKRTVLAQIADVLLHLLRSRGAVEPQHINWEWLQDRYHCSYIGADQHCAGGLHRHAHHQRTPLACLGEGVLNALQGCLDLQHVLAGLDNK